MKYNIEIGGEKFIISPYDTQKEKEILLKDSFEDYNLDGILEILDFNKNNPNVNLKDYPDDLKKYIIYKHREISIGSDINVSFKCGNCKTGNDAVIEIKDIIENGKIIDNTIRSLDIEVSEENLHLFLKDKDEEYVDNLSLEEMDELLERVENAQLKFNYERICKCLNCRTEQLVSIGENKFVISTLSEDSLMSLYKTYNFLNYWGKYTKLDVDSMYPFERSIFVGLINKQKEDLAK